MAVTQGQRFDVWEILPGNEFVKIKGLCIKIGQQITVEDPNISSIDSGVLLVSKYVPSYHYPVEGKLKKVGTLIIKKVKNVSYT